MVCGLFRARWLNRIRPLSSNLKSTWRIVVVCAPVPRLAVDVAATLVPHDPLSPLSTCASGRERACQSRSRCRTESWAAGSLSAAGLGATAMHCLVTALYTASGER